MLEDCGAAIGAREGVDAASEAECTVEDRMGASEAAVDFFTICGGWSVVECFPVVHGGMERNSSKVRTRGLQQLQPVRKIKFNPYYAKIIGLAGRKSDLSAPHGRLGLVDDSGILLRDLWCRPCHSLGGRTLEPS